MAVASKFVHLKLFLLCLQLFSLFQFNRSVDMLSDAQRIERIKLLVDNGYSHRVVVAQDIHLKHRLVYTHKVLQSFANIHYYGGGGVIIISLVSMLLPLPPGSGEVRWTWLCSHNGEHSTKDEGQGDSP